MRAPVYSLVVPRRARGALPAVTFVVPDYYPATGGTSSMTGRLATALSEEGLDVTVLTRRRDHQWPRHEERDGVHIMRFGPRGRRGWSEKVALISLTGLLVRRRATTDVVQLVMYPDFAFPVTVAGLRDRAGCTWAAMGEATRVVQPGHSRLRRIQGAVRRWALEPLDHVVLTRTMADELRQLSLHADPAIIPPPIDPEFFRPPSPAERDAARQAVGMGGGAFVIVYTGHLRALKRIDRLIDAVAGLDAAGVDVRLVLVGSSRGADDDVEAELREQVKRGRLDDIVVFAGAAPGPEGVRRHLWTADAFVLPSEQEGLSVSMLEAMACGLACVASSTAGGDDALSDGAGIVPPSAEPDDLQAALASLAADADRRLQIGAAARRRVEAFTPERLAGAYRERWARRAGQAHA